MEKYDKRYDAERITVKDGLPVKEKEAKEVSEIDEEGLDELKKFPTEKIIVPTGSDMNDHGEEIKKTFCVERMNGDFDYFHDVDRVVAYQSDGLIHIYSIEEQVAFYRVNDVVRGFFL